jgi:hypothetical protein
MAEVDAPAAVEPKAAPVEAPKEAPKGAETPAPDEAPKETRTYTQDDLDRITAKVKKNERYRTRKEVEAFYQGRESAVPRTPEKPAAPAEDKPPQRDQYESYEAFLDAKADYTGRRAAREERVKGERELSERKAAEAQAERVKTLQAKVNEKYPDLAERAEAIAHIQMPPGMGAAIAESDFNADILNHFADNPKDFERIVALSPSAAIREIGRLEARLEGAATKPAPVVEVKPSSAPAPLKPVGGTAVLGDGEPSHDKPDEWRKWRDRQVAAKRRPAATK